MSWVRRAANRVHTCTPPMRDIIYTISAEYCQGNQPARWTVMAVDGAQSDLWRCDTCGALWRVGIACDWCDAHGSRPHAGLHDDGLEWRPATLWQRLRHRANKETAA